MIMIKKIYSCYCLGTPEDALDDALQKISDMKKTQEISTSFTAIGRKRKMRFERKPQVTR